MSENAYLEKPTHTKARMEVAGVEGTLEWVVDNLDTQWCEMDNSCMAGQLQIFTI